MPGDISWKNILKAGLLAGTSGKSLSAGKLARDLQAADDAKARRQKPGKFKQAAAAAGIAAAVHASGTTPPQTGPMPLKDEAQALTQDERARRARTQRNATTSKGYGSKGSSGKR